MNPGESDSLLSFPCAFTVKAMGHNEKDFIKLVEGIVRRHLDPEAPFESRLNPSRKQNYISVSVEFTAHSREQLDAIYMDLTSEPRVLVAL